MNTGSYQYYIVPRKFIYLESKSENDGESEIHVYKKRRNFKSRVRADALVMNYKGTVTLSMIKFQSS